MTEPRPIATSPSTPSVPRQPPAPAPPPSPLDQAFLTNQPNIGVLILVRHGQQQWPAGPNPPASDWVDPPLSETGRRQADILAAALADERLDAVFCSHLRRAHETARAIGARHDTEVEVYPELREVEIYRDLPDGVSVRDALSEPVLRGVRARFVNERRWDVFPYTETSAEFRHRVVTIIEGILTGLHGAHLAVVCHGGVINAYLGHLLGLSEDMFFRPGHASVSRVLVGDGRRVVRTLNETHHLSAADAALVTF